MRYRLAAPAIGAKQRHRALGYRHGVDVGNQLPDHWQRVAVDGRRADDKGAAVVHHRSQLGKLVVHQVVERHFGIRQGLPHTLGNPFGQQLGVAIGTAEEQRDARVVAGVLEGPLTVALPYRLQLMPLGQYRPVRGAGEVGIDAVKDVQPFEHIGLVRAEDAVEVILHCRGVGIRIGHSAVEQPRLAVMRP